MKKLVLAALGFGCILFSKSATAQSFSLQKDTVKYVVYSGNVNIHNDVTNTGSSAIAVDWKVIDHTLPLSWQEGVGICDNVICYAPSILGTGVGTPEAAPYTAPGGLKSTMPFTGTMDFKLQINVDNSTAGGPYYIVVELKEGSTTDTAVFALTKWPTNVNKTPKAENGITIYPNPARSEVNVLFDPNAGIKNIAVYNLIGKAVTVYRVNGGSAKLDIDNIPSGIYFMRFVDAAGRVVATRKFTHQ